MTGIVTNMDQIHDMIFFIRGQKVMLSSDLAQLYEVKAKVLLQAVKRNIKRFPKDFMFQLSWDEVNCLVEDDMIPLKHTRNPRSQIVTLESGYNIKHLPFAFMEQGVAMLSSVLRSERAVQVNIEIMRAFVNMRQVLFSQKDGLEKLEDLERIQKIHGHLLIEHNDNIAIIFEAIRRLETVPDEEKKKIGFQTVKS